ncbi:endo-1,4-beta-xylanase [Hymenobacter metallilatus]|uniref:T9SS C-terminal target domain-containing protein n=1 Tax=Hymenobacter metallilatus TaxID=2493666 RepID=A0A3R9MK78_9BACT|nr:endo-1,4-beta-xylanase [Hymenobacter metallilatus]RSK33800.1 T9SS C-terminal target domain-containing protein [Hymenobacter metallilatus]
MNRTATLFSGLLGLLVLSAAPAALGQNTPVSQQAESGALGADWQNLNASGVQYVTITPTATINAQNPGTAARVVSYSVTFPGPGTYDLYVRMRVNAGGANDDSFYYANGFGTKSPSADTDWITCNNLFNVGYTGGSLPVDNQGSAGTGVWKWVNMSKYSYSETPVSFTVPAGALTQTFQLGAREDGFDIDKLVFGQTGLYFTPAQLDAGQQGTTTPPTTFTPAGPPMAQGKSKYLGGIYSTAQKPFFNRYFNQVTPENAGKWGAVEATRNQMNWAELDSAYNLARRNGFPFKLHTLIWGQQQPIWIETLPAAEQLLEIREWFQAVAQRYPNIDQIEVVNEPTNDLPLNGSTGNNGPNTPGSGAGNYYNALGGAGTTGWDWVITSFQLARQYFPNSQLLINDYGVISYTTNTQRYLDIVNLLVARNLVDGVGIQGHAFETRNIPVATLTTNLSALAAAGKPLYITELDIDGVNSSNQLDDAVQLAEYQRVFPALWEHPGVKGITLWGYRPGHWRTAQGAYLANDDNTERTALVWLKNYVRTTILKNRSSQQTLVQLYPNPTQDGRITLTGTQRIVHVRIVDMQGRSVYTQALHQQSTFALPVQLGAGLYAVQLTEQDGGLITSKLLVQ